MKKVFLIIYTVICFIGTGNFVSAQLIDRNFTPIIKGAPSVDQLYSLPDGKIIVVGNITMVDNTITNGIVRLNPDGTLDTTFQFKKIPHGWINTIYYDQEIEKIYIGGTYNNHNDIFRINNDGTLDDTFIPNVNLISVYQINKQSNGKLIILSNSANLGIVRLDEDGIFDDTFIYNLGANKFSNYENKLSILSNDKIVIGGTFTTFNGEEKSNLVMLNADGSFDSDFDFGSGITDLYNHSCIDNIIELDNGNLFLSGTFQTIQDKVCNGMAIILQDGSLDPSFTLDGEASLLFSQQVIAIKNNNGKIIVAGIDKTFKNYKIVKLNSDGTINSSFVVGNAEKSGTSSGALNSTPVLAIDSQNKLYIGASQINYNSQYSYALSKIDADLGVFENSYDAKLSGSSIIYSSVLLPDGKILIGGSFISIGYEKAAHLAMLNPDGSVDIDFQNALGSGPNKYVTGINVDNKGNYLISGPFEAFNGHYVDGLVRIYPDGTFDNSFNPNVSTINIQDVLILPNDQIIIVGGFTAIDYISRQSVAKLNSDGSLDETFNSANVIPSKSVITSIKAQSDKFIIGGLNRDNGIGILLRFDSNGNIDPNFDNSFDLSHYQIRKIELLPDNSILASSNDTKNLNDHPLLQFNSDGNIIDYQSIIASFNTISEIQIIDQNNIYVGGQFNSINNVDVRGFAKISLDGSIDPDFIYDFKAFVNYVVPNIFEIIPVSENILLLSGGFRSIDGIDVANIVKLNITTPKDPEGLQGIFNFAKGVVLNWTDNSLSESGFEVYRKVTTGSYTMIGTTGPNITTFEDTTVKLDSTYWYTVRAIHNDYYSNYTDTVEVLVESLTPPSGITANFDFNQGATLTWNNNETNDGVIELYKSINNINFEKIADLSTNDLAYLDSNVELNTDFFYFLRVVVGLFTSENSDTLKYTSPSPTLITPPFNLAIDKPISTLLLSWEYDIDNFTGFEIYRKSSLLSEFEPIGTANVFMFEDNTFAHEETYTYKVRAYNSFETSDFSDPLSFLVTGIEDKSFKQSITVHPNPVSSQLTLATDVYVDTYQIIDIKGKIIQSAKMEIGNNKIDVSHLLPGIYILKISGKDINSIIRFVVDR